MWRGIRPCVRRSPRCFERVPRRSRKHFPPFL